MTKLLADQALDRFIELMLQRPVGQRRVIDVGSGPGDHARIMRAKGLDVLTVDTNPQHKPDVVGEIRNVPYSMWKDVDGIWCSHVLEHAADVSYFLSMTKVFLAIGGILAITVPPRKDAIVGGHLSLWNAGLLVYNLVRNRYDCSNARIKTYGYNCSVIVENAPAKYNIDDLVHDNGDIETLKPWLPDFFHHGVNGMIEEWNWK